MSETYRVALVTPNAVIAEIDAATRSVHVAIYFFSHFWVV